MVRDAAAGLPGPYGVITTFDVVDPLALLQSIRDAVVPGGRHLCLDIDCSADPTGNTGPIAALLYGFSMLYCMTPPAHVTGRRRRRPGRPRTAAPGPADPRGQGPVQPGAAGRDGNPFNNLYELTR